MHPQYVAIRSSTKGPSEALESQFRSMPRDGYISNKDSIMLPAGISQETLTSSTDVTAQSVSEHSFFSNRRHRCQRASNYWQLSALSLSLLPVRASSRSKNLSLLTQPRFRLSQYTPANTSNTLTRWALLPASTTPQIDGHLAGEAASC
jgi:hypothetical protein